MSSQNTPPWQQAARRLRGYGSAGNLRVSDAERSEVADLLSRHYGDGRLDQAEFEQRMDLAMHAKTYADLNGLMTDLPEAEAVAQPGSPGSPALSRRQRGGRRHPVLLIALLVVIAGLAWHALTWPFAIHAWFGPWPLIALFVVIAVFVARRRRGPS
jgi:ferric-dicitrate binding protein FerR (iron transport regulator)